MKQKNKLTKFKNKILVCLGIMLILVSCLTAMVQAGSYVQGQKGNFNLTLQQTDSDGNQTPLAGVKLKLYKVGTVEFDGNVHFKIDSQLSSTGIDFDTLESAGDWYSAAETLANVIGNTSIASSDAMSDTQGKISYTDQEEGIYLIIGSEDSIATVTPMLLTMPFANDDEGWVYDVQAYPKVVKRSSDTTGITVTKRLYYLDNESATMIPLYTEDSSFKIGLFLDKEGTIPYGDDYIRTIRIQNASSGSATFDGVPSGTYYIYELDDNDQVTALNETITVSGDTTYYYNITNSSDTEDNSVKIDETSNPKATVYVNNNYYDIPDNAYFSGIINVKKNVIVDGQATEVDDDVFYVGIFKKESDGSETLVANEELLQNGEVTVEFKITEEEREDSMTYVVKETDKDGNPVDKDTFPYEVSGEGDVTLTKSDTYETNTELTNSKKTESTITPSTTTITPTTEPGTGDNTPDGGTSSKNPVKTGDTTNLAVWGILIVAAIGAIIFIFIKKRKKNN